MCPSFAEPLPLLRALQWRCPILSTYHWATGLPACLPACLPPCTKGFQALGGV